MLKSNAQRVIDALQAKKMGLAIGDLLTQELIRSKLPGTNIVRTYQQNTDGLVLPVANLTLADLTKIFSSVSRQVAGGIADSLASIRDNNIGLSITGYADTPPGGEALESERGHVFIGLTSSFNSQPLRHDVFEHRYSGTAGEIRLQAAEDALQHLRDLLDPLPSYKDKLRCGP